MLKRKGNFGGFGVPGVILGGLFILVAIYRVFELVASISSGIFLSIIISIIFLFLYLLALFGFFKKTNWSLVLVTVLITIDLVTIILIGVAGSILLLFVVIDVLIVSLAVSLMRKWKNK